MQTFVQLLISGMATGAIYALMAIGFSLLWQTSQTINFAQGQFVMLPAFLVLAGMRFLGLPFWLALILGAAVAVVVLGLLFKRMIVDPVLPHGVLALVIATIALAIILEQSVKTFYSPEAQPFPALIDAADIRVEGIVISVQNLAVLAVAGCSVLLLQLLLTRTRTGRCMQATAQNPAVARLLGIPTARMVLYTFMINAVLVTLASILIAPLYLPKFSNGATLGTAAFISAIVGGLNQVRGAVLGGFLLGITDNMMAMYVSNSYRAVVPLLVLVLVILWRPQGLLGRKEERTV